MSPDTRARQDGILRSHHGIPLVRKVEILSSPETYGLSDNVTSIETHFSWIFLVGNSVYKLKKPIRKSYVDFSTLGLRRSNCTLEVALNRRLTDGVYLGVEAVLYDPSGRWILTADPGTHDVVEWVVHQRCLDPKCCMLFLMETSSLASGHLESLVQKLGAFYALQSPLPWSPDYYVRRLHLQLADCGNAFAAIPGGFSKGTEDLLGILDHFIERSHRVLAHRVTLGRLFEGHGDLRPEHIFFEETPQIIDCLEFSYELRCRDPMDEIAYLIVECESLGRKDVSAYIREAIPFMWGDAIPADLAHFYVAFRAALRAKLACWRFLDAVGSDREHWEHRMRSYLSIAEEHAGSL